MNIRDVVAVEKILKKPYIPIVWKGIKTSENRIFTNIYKKGYYKGQKADGYPITKEMRQTLDTVKGSVLYKNNDFVTLIDGNVGLGKSTLACQIAKYLDPTFNLSQLCFNPQQFMEAIKSSKPFKAIILDEAMTLNSRNSMTQDNKQVNQLLSQIRSHSLFLILNIPSAHDIDRSLFLSRCGMLIHCYSPSFGTKGYYKVFHKNKQRLKNLYLLGKKMYSYSRPPPNFKGGFSSCFVLDQKEYNKKKDKAIFNPQLTQTHTAFQERNIYIKGLREKGLSYEEIHALNPKGISENAIGKICRNERGAIKNEKEDEN